MSAMRSRNREARSQKPEARRHRAESLGKRVFILASGFWLLASGLSAFGQNTETGPPLQLVQPPGQAAAPPVITLQDALDRAKNLDGHVQSAMADAAVAREDRLQAKASLLPSVSHTTQYLGTQGNGVVVTVTKNYYGLITSQRKYATAQQSLQQAQRFLDITGQQERLGQVARSDVVKAQIQYEQQRQNFQEATLAMENARLNLAVLIFPGLNENFTVVDDLDSARALPPFDEVQAMGERQNPDLRVAEEALRQAG